MNIKLFIQPVQKIDLIRKYFIITFKKQLSNKSTNVIDTSACDVALLSSIQLFFLLISTASYDRNVVAL